MSKTGLHIPVPSDLHHRFKVRCAEERITMAELIISWMEEYLTNKKPKVLK